MPSVGILRHAKRPELRGWLAPGPGRERALGVGLRGRFGHPVQVTGMQHDDMGANDEHL
jgi:hypothetical protein